MNNEIQIEEKVVNKTRMKSILFKGHTFFVILFLIIFISNYSTYPDLSINALIKDVAEPK